MNVVGIVLLLFVSVCALAMVFVVADNMNMNAPVDSAGATVPAFDNQSRASVGNVTPVTTAVGGGIVLIIGALIMFAAIIFFVGARHLAVSRRF